MGGRAVAATIVVWAAVVHVTAATRTSSDAPVTHGGGAAVQTTAPPSPAPLSDTCIVCHNNLVTPSGEDVSIGSDWRASMMANSARDPYWQAAVRREVIDHPEAAADIEDECSICHMPLATYADRQAGSKGRIFSRLPIGEQTDADDLAAADGVACAACHQISPERLGTTGSFTGGYVLTSARPDGAKPMFGPFAIDAGRTTLMRSATGFVPTEAPHTRTSELCASCHTLYTTALGPNHQILGRLPEQMPYLEWQHSAYSKSRTCQSCHMPEVAEPVAVTGVLGQPRDQVSRHVFLGGNFFMMRMLNRYRDELGVVATPQEMERAIGRTIAHLQRDTASVAIEPQPAPPGRLEFDVVVANLAGHKFPTAYPSRRAWLHVVVRDAAGRTIFESGGFEPDGRIRGNDNDDNPARFEPHHTRIEREADVQIYEAIMAGADGGVTTGLLTGVRYLKDNRVLPDGFDKRTAHADVAVHGAAATDADFEAGRDRVRYAIDVAKASGPLQLTVELWFQPIAFRWADNLRPYDAFETRRFVRYYESMSGASAIVVARASHQRP
jgi:hypothetical protein